MSRDTKQITCPSCSTVYRVPREALTGEGRILRCSVCNHRFMARLKKKQTSEAPVEPAVPPLPTFESGDESLQESADTSLPDAGTDETLSAADEAAVDDNGLTFGESEDEPAPTIEPDFSDFEDGGSEVVSDDDLSFGEEPDDDLTIGEEPEEDFTADVAESHPDDDALTIGESDDEDTGASFDERDIGDLEIGVDADEGDEEDGHLEESERMVEFFVEDEQGSIERVETHAKHDDSKPAGAKTEELSQDLPDEDERVDDSPEYDPGEMTVELPEPQVKADAGLLVDDPEADEPPPVEMPDPPRHKFDDVIVQSDAEPQAETKRQPKRWRDPMKTSGRRSLLQREEEAEPSSGKIYHAALIVLGALGLASNYLVLDSWRFDPVWSAILVCIGVAGLFMQNLSGLYIAGFFTIFHAFGLFAFQRSNLESGLWNGIIHLGVLAAVAVIALASYYLLINRKRGLFRLKEGVGFSIWALSLGFIAILIGVWAHLQGSSIPPLGKWMLLDTSLENLTFYSGVPLQMILASGLASLAVAFGFAAQRVRNRLLLLGASGALLGLLVLALFYIRLLTGDLQITLPF